jgi:hypothetical protein
MEISIKTDSELSDSVLKISDENLDNDNFIDIILESISKTSFDKFIIQPPLS